MRGRGGNQGVKQTREKGEEERKGIERKASAPKRRRKGDCKRKIRCTNVRGRGKKQEGKHTREKGEEERRGIELKARGRKIRRNGDCKG